MIIGLLIVIVSIILFIIVGLTEPWDLEVGLFWGLGILTTFGIILLIVGMIGYDISVDGYAKIEAYDAKVQDYQKLIGDAPPGLLGEAVTVLGNATINYLYQREIEEKRAYYRMVNRNWFLRHFVAKPPKDLLG